MPYVGKKPADIIATAVDTTTGTFSGEVDAASLDISGNIDVDGTTNLDVVDIDGAVDMASTLTVTGVAILNGGIDIAGDFTLDVGGGDISIKDDGTTMMNIGIENSDVIFNAQVSDKDIIFKGNDGGSSITALTLDMSAAGAAAFNSYLTSTAVYGKDDGNTGIQFDGSDVITLHTGGAEHMKIDANGHITKPNQPAFQVRKSADQSNVSASDGVVTVSFDTEVFDVNSDFASNTFTAPVTGKYFLSINVYLGQIDTAASYILIGIRTSNRDYYRILDPNFSADVNYYGMNFSVLADLDASDTAFIWWQSNGGTAQVDIIAANGTQFQGCLLS